MPQPHTLVSRYRPERIEDMVLPRRHTLHKALEFLQKPYPSAWLLAGPSGLGKTSLALMMAKAACSSEFGRQVYVGPSFDSRLVEQLALTIQHRPVWGGLHAVVVNEADSIPKGGQVRLLDLVEDMDNAVVICTANSDLESYESRLTSRLYVQSFTKEGILEPAIAWLAGIAALEGIPASRKILERMVVESKSNLRAALQRLDVYAARPTIPTPTLTTTQAAGDLPVDRARTTVESPL